MERPAVVVIGAGVGGIAAAARLARHGCKVTVVEKCDRPGGRCGRLEKDGHRFDTGSTLFLMPGFYAETFADLGERMEDHLDLRQIDPTYRIHFGDGSSLSLTPNLEAMRVQLEGIETGSFEGLLRYLIEGRRHYQLAMTHLVTRNFRSLREYCSPKNLWLLFQLKGLTKHYDNMGSYFRDHRLKAAFTFQDLYVGMSPYHAPATFSLLAYSELAEGVWLPMGGMYRVVEALTTIAEQRGVRFMYETPVKEIETDGRQAIGVALTDRRFLPADIVVANADLPYVYRHLLPSDGAADRLERKKYGCSAFTFHWGVSGQYPQLGPHNLFLAGDDRRSFDQIFQDLSLPEDASLYVHAPARVDPSMAPDGQDTLTAAVPVGHLDGAGSQDWPALQIRARHMVIQRLKQIGLADIENHIKFEVSFTPRDWERRYNLFKGSTHGLSHTLMQMGYLRPRNRHQRYRNLYFVGASTHPGTGMPTVLVSARLATERILEDTGLRQMAHSESRTSTWQGVSEQRHAPTPREGIIA